MAKLPTRANRRQKASGGDSYYTTGGGQKKGVLMGVFMGAFVMAMMVRIRESGILTGGTVVPATVSSKNDLLLAASSTPISTTTTNTNKIPNTNKNPNHKSKKLRIQQEKHPAFRAEWDIYQQIEAQQTGRVSGPRTKPPMVHRQVHFLDQQQLAEDDAFSASWLQTTESFLTMELDRMGICEDAAFYAFRAEKMHKLRMTMDWLDFGIEHMSKWYRILEPFENEIPYKFAISKLEAYVQKAQGYPLHTNEQERPALHQTLAVIAFMHDENNHHKEKSWALMTRNLAATIESLRRAGMGRVVVVGMNYEEDKDRKLTEEAFRMVHKYNNNPDDSTSPTGSITKVGHMEVGFVQAGKDDGANPYIPINVPKATLIGLRRAFQFAQGQQPGPENVNYIKTWLGDHPADYWKYVYLTEPDSILNTRPNTLHQLKESADQGNVVVPHRFQPIPHETDVRGMLKKHLYIAQAGEHFYDVRELNSLDVHSDKCCDEVKGPNFKPGLPPNFPECGNFWYMCGFHRDVSVPEEERSHKRLEPYKLIRLTQGTQFTLLASQEHGRRCIPHISNNADVCAAPPQ